MKIYALLLTALLALFCGCGKARRELHVFVWPGYFSDTLIADFERQFDCRLVIDHYDDNESMVAKVGAGGAAYDIIVPSTYVIPGMIGRGLLAPLRRENLPNMANLEPRFLATEFDPENRYTVPLAWGTAGILIRREAGRDFEESWDLFFDSARQPGPFLMMEDPRAWIDLAMVRLGYLPNTVQPEELAQGRDLLLEVKRRSLGFATQMASISRLLSKEARMTVALSMDAVRAMREDPALHYFIPREGGGRWMDNLAIPAQARHRDLAEKFINYLLDGRVAAGFANFTSSSSPNRAAMEFLAPQDRTNAVLYPPEEVYRRLWYAKDLGDKQSLYDAIWTDLKSK